MTEKNVFQMRNAGKIPDADEIGNKKSRLRAGFIALKVR
jgi:hypothetical protein